MAFTIQDVNDEVRFLLGGLSQTVMDDVTMNKIIQKVVDKYSLEDEDFCIVVYESTLAVLRYLITQQCMDSGDTGKVTKRREKNNRREIEENYSDDKKTGYQKLLDDFIKHPEYVCDELPAQLNRSGGNVIIGGVSQSEYDRVDQDPDSRDGYQESVQKKYDAKTTCNVRGRNKNWPW